MFPRRPHTTRAADHRGKHASFRSRHQAQVRTTISSRFGIDRVHHCLDVKKAQGEGNPIFAPKPIAKPTLKPRLALFSKSLKDHKQQRSLKSADDIVLAREPFSAFRVKSVFGKILSKDQTTFDMRMLTRALNDTGLRMNDATAYAEAYFLMNDLNRDGSIDLHEYMQDQIRQALFHNIEDILAGKLDIFQLDKDGDGQLDFFELTRFLCAVFGMQLGKREARRVFTAMDITQSGRISFRDMGMWVVSTRTAIPISEVATYAIKHTKPRMKVYASYNIPQECLAILPEYFYTKAKEDARQKKGLNLPQQLSIDLQLIMDPITKQLTPMTADYTAQQEMLARALSWQVKCKLYDLSVDYDIKVLSLFRHFNTSKSGVMSKQEFLTALTTTFGCHAARAYPWQGMLPLQLLPQMAKHGGETYCRFAAAVDRLSLCETQSLLTRFETIYNELDVERMGNISGITFVDLILSDKAVIRAMLKQARKLSPITGTIKSLSHLYPMLSRQHDGSKESLKALFKRIAAVTPSKTLQVTADDVKTYFDRVLRLETRKSLEQDRPLSSWAAHSGPLPSVGMRRRDATALILFLDYNKSASGGITQYKFLMQMHKLDKFDMKRYSRFTKTRKQTDKQPSSLFASAQPQNTSVVTVKNPAVVEPKSGHVLAPQGVSAKKTPKPSNLSSNRPLVSDSRRPTTSARVRSKGYSAELRSKTRHSRAVRGQERTFKLKQAQESFDNSFFLNAAMPEHTTARI